ncbi:hypothetical protein CPC08DRAFT_666141 [Agrocybe pediades]|nr:hypothetical protein CPC08DRAFT_666141 [Agrocybe pediades]
MIFQSCTSTGPQLKGAVAVAIAKIEEYVKKSRKTRIYALAMIIHPATKLQWIKDHWSDAEHRAAKDWMLQSMFEYRKLSRKSGSGPRAEIQLSRDRCKPAGSSSRANATQSLSDGLASVRSLKQALKRSASEVLPGPSTRNMETLPNCTEPTRDDEGTEAQADEKDKKSVTDELQRYLDEGLVSGEE